MNNLLPRIRIIILNYNSSEHTLNLCNQLEEQDYPNFETIIVDNCSEPQRLKQLKEELHPSFFLIESSENLGYSGGNNLGLRHNNSDFIKYQLVLNNDLVIKDKSFITKMVKGIEDNKESNVVASSPLVENLGSETKPWESIQVRRVMGKTSMYIVSVPILNKIFKRNHDKFVYREEIPYNDKYLVCDSINGAAFIIDNQFLIKNNYLDEGTFLFFEEIILGRQIKDERKNCLLNGFTTVLHLQGVSTKSNKDNLNLKMERFKMESALYYLQKYDHLNTFYTKLFILLNEISLFLKKNIK